VNELNNHGPFANSRGDPLYALSSDVANREDAGKACFKRISGAAQRPAVLNLSTGLDEALCVECDTSSKPFRVRVGAGHHKNMLDVPGFARSSLGIMQANTVEMRLAFESLDRGPSHERNPRACFDSRYQVSRHCFGNAGSSHHEINMLSSSGKKNQLLPRLRDTFAVDLLEKGGPLEEVSKLLGHESIKTTERSYAKWVKGRQDRLDNLVTGTWKK
jgi:hypothetical protein